MIILNETIIIDESIQTEWLHWIKTIYIPTVMEVGQFKSFRMLNVVNSPNEGVTYCLQFEADVIDTYHEYQQIEMTKLRNAHHKQFENRFVLFETLMQPVI